MTAEIISIGDELLIGQVINTNASWISKRLDAAGIRTLRHQAVRDSEKEITDAINLARDSSGIIIITGGLGPTDDDKTRDTLCKYFEDSLVRDEQVLADISGFFAGRGLELTERNIDQAMVPSKCIAIRNPHGTAPGFFFEENGVILVSMPGVPYEMKAMMDDFVVPQLQKRIEGLAIIHRNVMTIGIGESFLADKILDWENRLPADLKLAYLPGAGMVRLRLSCYESGPGTEEKMRKVLSELDELIGKYIYSYRDESIEEALAAILLKRQETVSTAESCSGGFIASSFTNLPGCSKWFTGGVVAYTNEVKVATLGVNKELIREKGVVSEEVALSMAERVRKFTGSDWGLSTTGVAGPHGGTDDTPVGTVWIGIAGPNGSRAKQFKFIHNRQRNIELTKLFGINELRKEILDAES